MNEKFKKFALIPLTPPLPSTSLTKFRESVSISRFFNFFSVTESKPHSRGPQFWEGLEG